MVGSQDTSKGAHAMRKPLVSYVILTRNRAGDLAENLDQLAGQTYKPLEVVVIVNGPDDETVELLRSKYAWVNVVQPKENLGVAGGRNLGIKNAKGEIIICVDDDAIVKDPQLTERVVQYFRVNTHLGVLAFAEHSYFKPDQHIQWGFPGRTPERDGDTHFETYYFPGAGHAYRAAALNETGLYPERYFFTTEEKDLSYRMLDHGYQIWYSPVVRVYHKVSPKGRDYYRGMHELRNHIWFGMRLLSWPRAIGYGLFWLVYVAIRAFPKHLKAIPQALREAWQNRKEILLDRRPISSDTLAKMRDLRPLGGELRRKLGQVRRLFA